jgi:predicted enzyme related to lactoylglutathione lyase
MPRVELPNDIARGPGISGCQQSGSKPLRSRTISCGLSITALLVLATLPVGPRPGFCAAAPVFPPLTTVSGSPSLPGKFVWADLVTDNVPAALKFYQGLFGWRFQSAGNYAIALNQERPLCGMFQRPRPEGKAAQPRWFGYISTSSVGRAQRTVTKLGGRVLAAPQKFPKRGEQAVFADPEGAVFGVVKSSSGDPEDFLPDPGDWVWIQLLSRDASKAAEFYHTVAGYEVVSNTASNRLSDYVLVSEGYARATVRSIPSGKTEVQPTWLPFVRVKNVGESVARAKELGGQVRIEPKPDLFDGKVAVVSDPTGAAIGLLEWSHEMLKGGSSK